jgi:hypothetical protein
MLKRALTIAVLAAVLVYGVVHLFLLRFQTGDVYPEYSSLRADPLGAKGLHDALLELPQLDVRRNYRPIEKLRPGTPTTLLYAGTPRDAFWRDKEVHEVETLLEKGARVVVTFLPVGHGPTKREQERIARHERELAKERSEREKKEKEGEKHAEPPGDGEPEPVEAPLLSFDLVAKRWGFSFKYLQGAPTFRYTARLRDGPGELEPEISWHSALHFVLENGGWKTIYSNEDQPVIIERTYGKGSIVLCADSYFLSNEALRKERHPTLLAWLIGPSRTVVFDEESHGVSEDTGIVSLIRKYRLQGVVAGLLLLALLFVWKNAVPLVPPFDDPETSGAVVTGKHAGEGFVNLLRRSIEPREVLNVCAEEWKKSFNHDGRNVKAVQLDRVLAGEASKPARTRDPVAAYRKICGELSRK